MPRRSYIRRGRRREPEPVMNTAVVRIMSSPYVVERRREQDEEDMFEDIPIAFLPIRVLPEIHTVDNNWTSSRDGTHRAGNPVHAPPRSEILDMARIACRECGSACSCYFDHCPSFLCHHRMCPGNSQRRRGDGLFRFVATRQLFGYLSHPDDNGGNKYLIPHDLLVKKRCTIHFVTIFKDGLMLLEVREQGTQAVDVVVHPAPDDFYLGKSFTWEKSVDEYGRTVYNPDGAVVARFAETESIIDTK